MAPSDPFCPCFSPNSVLFSDLDEAERTALKRLHHDEDLITEEECRRFGKLSRERRLHAFSLAVDKCEDEVLRMIALIDGCGLCGIAQRMRAISHLHHKEGLLTKEECVRINETLGNWCKVVVHKRSEEAVRIVDILVDHGLDDEAQRIKALIDLYHNEQLLTNEEGAHFQGPFGNWRKAIVKDSYTAGKICNILRKYKYYEEQMMIQVIAALYHKERVLSKKGAIKSLQGFVEGWYNRLFYEVKDSGFYCAARLVHTLNQCGLFDVVEKARAFYQTLPPKSGMGSEFQQYMCTQDDVGVRGCVSEFDTSFLEAIREVCPNQEHNASGECHFPQDKLKGRLINSYQVISDEDINQCPPLGYVAGSIHLLNSSNSLTVCILRKFKHIICNILQVAHYAVILRGYREGSSEVHFFIARALEEKFCNRAPSIAALSLREAGDVILAADVFVVSRRVVDVKEIRELSPDIDIGSSDSQSKVEEVLEVLLHKNGAYSYLWSHFLVHIGVFMCRLGASITTRSATFSTIRRAVCEE